MFRLYNFNTNLTFKMNINYLLTKSEMLIFVN